MTTLVDKDYVDGEIAKVRSEVWGLDRAIDGLGHKIDGIYDKIDGLKSEINGVKSEMKAHDERLDSIRLSLEGQMVLLREGLQGQMQRIAEQMQDFNENVKGYRAEMRAQQSLTTQLLEHYIRINEKLEKLEKK